MTRIPTGVPESDSPLLSALRRLSGDAGLATGDDYRMVTGIIGGRLRTEWYPARLSEADIEDITADVVVKLIRRCTTGEGIPNPTYVYVTAQNAAIDVWRRKRRLVYREASAAEQPEALTSDDEVSAAFEAQQTAASVVRALAEVRAAGDRVTFMVVTAALDQTQVEGRRPSNRQLAERLGLSHTAVNKALHRFRSCLQRHGG